MLFSDNDVKKSTFFFTEGPSPLKSMNSTAYSKVSMRQLTMNELLQSVKQSYYHEVLSYPNKDGRYLRQSAAPMPASAPLPRRPSSVLLL